MGLIIQHLLLLPSVTAIGIYQLPPVPSRLTAPASVATYAASVASAQATALSTQNAYGISTGTPDFSLPDPCGPPQQVSASPGTLSTCHLNISIADTTSTSAYGATCLKTSDPALASITRTLDVNACANAMIEICYALSGTYGPPAQDAWVFTNGTQTSSSSSFGEDGGGNCTMGFWLPEGGAPAPSFLRCVDGIFGPLVGTCGSERKGGGGGGAVNLEVLPGFGVGRGGENEGGVDRVGVGGTGVAFESGYPSYFFVA
ncbi:hypothetical protein ACLMJK_009472 [Lecanora helva]